MDQQGTTKQEYLKQPVVTKQQALRMLETYFGYTSFRPAQEAPIASLLRNEDVIGIMPTGAGKSICFQIPALCKAGLTIVFSPLISLMKDQVDGLLVQNIPAALINSTLTQAEFNKTMYEVRSGKIKLLYIAPERLGSNFFCNVLRALPIAQVIVDEAHCISHWGHDFRPEYTQLKAIRQHFPNVPVVALTATADKITREDIIRQLDMRNPEVFISSFDRPNLSLEVKRGYQQKEKIRAIVKFLRRHRNESGIIYCMSRNGTEKVAQLLENEGFDVGVYHAGMSNEQREMTQDDFINDRVQIICATIAFGMGIDKSNVRWVIHYNLPKSIENFYQEIGRAGRDGLPSETLLFYSFGDIVLLSKFAAESNQQGINLEKLNRMQQYAESDICRRRILLNYFGETMNHDCGNCDVCKNPPERFDGTIIVQKALSAIARADEQIGTRTLIDILKGYASQEVIEKGYDKLKTYGAGRDVPGKDWQDYLLQMLNLGYFEIAYNENNHLKITEAGKKVLFGKERAQLIVIKREESYGKKGSAKENKTASPAPLFTPTVFENEDEGLFEALRQLRKKLADQLAIPAYIVLSDKTLHLLALKKPGDMEAFGEISGIGEFKKEKYGKDFLAVINEYLGRN